MQAATITADFADRYAVLGDAAEVTARLQDLVGLGLDKFVLMGVGRTPGPGRRVEAGLRRAWWARWCRPSGRDRVAAEVAERHPLEGVQVGRLQHHGRGHAGVERFLPARRAQAPAVARLARPANPGCGVDRSLPCSLLKARNSSVTSAQTAWTPRSSPPVSQQPVRYQPVNGASEHVASSPPNTFRVIAPAWQTY